MFQSILWIIPLFFISASAFNQDDFNERTRSVLSQNYEVDEDDWSETTFEGTSWPSFEFSEFTEEFTEEPFQSSTYVPTEEDKLLNFQSEILNSIIEELKWLVYDKQDTMMPVSFERISSKLDVFVSFGGKETKIRGLVDYKKHFVKFFKDVFEFNVKEEISNTVGSISGQWSAVAGIKRFDGKTTLNFETNVLKSIRFEISETEEIDKSCTSSDFPSSSKICEDQFSKLEEIVKQLNVFLKNGKDAKLIKLLKNSHILLVSSESQHIYEGFTKFKNAFEHILENHKILKFTLINDQKHLNLPEEMTIRLIAEVKKEEKTRKTERIMIGCLLKFDENGNLKVLDMRLPF